MPNTIKNRLTTINNNIQQASLNAGRTDTDVALLAVSKKQSTANIQKAYEAGQRSFGENYCQEGIEKITQLSHLKGIEWHFIGAIQSNKCKAISHHFDWVHTVDRLKIAQHLSRHRAESEQSDSALNICLQINIDEENSKSGALYDEIPRLAEEVEKLPHLTLRGLMAIPKANLDSDLAFSKLQGLFIRLQADHSALDTLSIGMSQDYQNAIQYGATIVRIGSAIFGQRPPTPGSPL